MSASRARNDGEIEHAIAGIASKAGGGLIVLPEATTNARYEVIIALAARHRVPATYAFRYQAMGGGLISYGVDIADLFPGRQYARLGRTCLSSAPAQNARL